jgi:uncharacterized membrane protein
MRRLTLLSFLAFLILLVLLPIVFGEVMAGSLTKLHLSPGMAALLMIGIVFGGLINIPVIRLEREDESAHDPFAVYGLSGLIPWAQQMHSQTIIAVNVGGCLIPVGIALYELMRLSGGGAFAPALIASAVNTVVCFAAARPVPRIGITIPGLIPPAVAALMALALTPHDAAPVAFIAGVMGPLVGADLFHIRAFTARGVGMASIGGAGTFDGIVLSGIVAAYLA